MTSFSVIPAIDVLEGRCVRLSQGRRETVMVEGGDPAAAAARFVAEGARYLHLVDLDGAFSGRPSPGLVDQVVAAAGGVPVQAGGGLRNDGAVESALAAGASRAIVGTAALDDRLLTGLVRRFGPRLVVAIDVRDGRVVADGWVSESLLSPGGLALRCVEAGVERLLVTSTRRDGSLAGPDLGLLAEVIDGSGLPVLAAGGIGSLADLGRLRELGCEGAIVGAAIWTGEFSLADALAYSV
jgi:phosphoribosylformimino-5-aminoimidazole carboxamide ribotide isomerase